MSINCSAQIMEGRDISKSISNCDLIIEGRFIKNINDDWKVKIGKNRCDLYEFEVHKLFKGKLKSDTILVAFPVVMDDHFMEEPNLSSYIPPMDLGLYFVKSDTISEFVNLLKNDINYKPPQIDTIKLKSLVKNRNIGFIRDKFIYENIGNIKIINLEESFYSPIEKFVGQNRQIINSLKTQDSDVKEWLIKTGNEKDIDATGICYRFCRAELRYNSNKLDLNIEGKSSNWSTYFKSGKIIITYNTKAFGAFAIKNGNIRLSKERPRGNNRSFNPILKESNYNIDIRDLDSNKIIIEINKIDTAQYRSISSIPMDICHRKLCEYYPLFFLEFDVKDFNQPMNLRFCDSSMQENSFFYDRTNGTIRAYDYVFAKDKRDEIISFYKPSTISSITPLTVKPGSNEEVTVKGHHFQSIETSILIWCTKDERSFFMFIPKSNIISCSDDVVKFNIPENIDGWKPTSGHGIIITKQFEQEYIESFEFGGKYFIKD